MSGKEEEGEGDKDSEDAERRGGAAETGERWTMRA